MTRGSAMHALGILFAGILVVGSCTATAPLPSPIATARSSPTASPTERVFATGGLTPTIEPTIGPAGALRRVMVDALRVRDTPTISGSVVGVLHAGEIVEVQDTPSRADAFTWWRVSIGSLHGWAADSDGATAFLVAMDAPGSIDYNVWAATTTSGQMPALWAALPVRVYVPNEATDNMSVIDPTTFQVAETLAVGDVPLHITPAWDGSVLYVDNMRSNNLQEVDPSTAKLGAVRDVLGPYNLYFTPDGSRAIVVAEEHDLVQFYDPHSWQLQGSIAIENSAGADHGDFSAGGRYFLVSTEFGGDLFKIDVVSMEIVGRLHVGGFAIDVKLSPDGTVFFVANQGRHGVSVIDPITMTELAFIPTGMGAHGLAISRDARSLYVTNRDEGTISVISFATRAVTATWTVGSTPDMLQVSADGTQLWVSFRRDVYVGVVDTTSGHVLQRIKVGGAPHGLALFPQPGRFSLGHNGVYR